jgi:hypothetical protein
MNRKLSGFSSTAPIDYAYQILFIGAQSVASLAAAIIEGE